MPTSGELKTLLEELISPATLHKLGPDWLSLVEATFSRTVGKRMREAGLTAGEAAHAFSTAHEAAYPNMDCVDSCTIVALKAWNGE